MTVFEGFCVLPSPSSNLKTCWFLRAVMIPSTTLANSDSAAAALAAAAAGSTIVVGNVKRVFEVELWPSAREVDGEPLFRLWVRKVGTTRFCINY